MVTQTQTPLALSSVVVDTSHSPHARLRPVPIDAVTLRDEFWSPRRDINQRRTLPSQFEHIETTGRLANFRRAAGKEEGQFEGIFFNDSDIYKWLEAAASTIAATEDSDLSALIETAAREVAAAQAPDGYLDNYFTLRPDEDRWRDLRDMHQLYCMGHFIQAAVAHARATGSDFLLNVARRVADCLCATFGLAAEGKREETDGHEEIELALVELFRTTGEENYLKLAQFFVDVRGRGVIGGREYHQDHVPMRELTRLTGHAVRALYYASGATDIVLESGDEAMRAALLKQCDNLTLRQMYISGGAGSRWEGEAFGRDYELPNERAYTETCAAIGVMMWAWRMLQLEGEAKHTDVLERALYNGVLAGLSLDGQEYFYQNPLSDDGTHRRQPWFGCACCPPNVARLLAQLPGYFYSTSDEGIWTHLYAEGTATLALPQDGSVTLSQHTRYPWDGEVTLQIEEVSPAAEFTLFLRVPDWCNGATIEINGKPTPTRAPGSYAALRRAWRSGDTVRLHLPMPVRRVLAHPYAMENAGRVALMRGPLLYCIEETDHLGADMRDVVLPANAALETSFRPDLLAGVAVIEGDALLAPLLPEWNKRLYAPAGTPLRDEPRSLKLTAVPYYAWANRTPGRMQVWLREQ